MILTGFGGPPLYNIQHRKAAFHALRAFVNLIDLTAKSAICVHTKIPLPQVDRLAATAP